MLERDGLKAGVAALPRIHADVHGPFGHNADASFGSFGFYSGVTNVAVRVSEACDGGDTDAVDRLLRAVSG